MSLRVIFAGTPEIALPSLKALVASNHDVLAVLTQPDRRAGRGRYIKKSAVKTLAETYRLPVFQPSTLNQCIESKLITLKPDVIVVVAYGLLLPPSFLELPKHGCINLHFSLLPRWRGASPIQHTLLHGDSSTGATIIQMDRGLDTGPILAQTSCLIAPNENSAQLQSRLANKGAALLMSTLQTLLKSQSASTIQDESQATLAPKITKSQALIDWQDSANSIANLIRAFNPWPVAFTMDQGQRLRVWSAEVVNTSTSERYPGTIIKTDRRGIQVATGNKILRLLSLQRPGGTVIDSIAFTHARQFSSGNTVLGH